MATDDISVAPVLSLPRRGFNYPDFAPPPYLEAWRSLSHTENLYFVAGRSEVFIYQPSFPDQRLGSDPTLILQPSGPETAQAVLPGIPLGPGRYINHLIVDFLGNEEILLLALHNGGVIGYRISQIQQAFEKRQQPDCVETNIGDDVTPFFKEHVVKSAWGLAIHREARMIAVSSNTHKVTVFAFALDRHEATSPGPWFRDRSTSRKIELPVTGTNIPCVAFCNTADDPEGRWLLAADINGITRVYDLALIDHGTECCVHSTAPRFCVMGDQGDRAYCMCHSLDEFSHHYCHATWGALWLDSRAFKRAKNLEEVFGCHANPKQMLDRDTVYFDCSNRRSLVPNSSTTWQSDPNAPPEEPEDGFLEQGVVCWRKLMNGQIYEPEHSSPPSTSPILLLSIRDMIMLQPLKSGVESDQVAYHDPLFQAFSEADDMIWTLQDQDRLNLYAQIPELGVVIVGSAKGRVAVLSLTLAPTKRPGGKTYACRIDHILPTREQELKGERPMSSLAGIAVGPIQGMLGRDANHPRRWRLLMMYHDNEMLKYEISKRMDGPSSRVQGLSELII